MDILKNTLPKLTTGLPLCRTAFAQEGNLAHSDILPPRMVHMYVTLMHHTKRPQSGAGHCYIAVALSHSQCPANMPESTTVNTGWRALAIAKQNHPHHGAAHPHFWAFLRSQLPSCFTTSAILPGTAATSLSMVACSTRFQASMTLQRHP